MTENAVSWGSYADRIREAKNAADLDLLDLEIFGRKQGVLTMALKGLGALPEAERRARAEELNTAKRQLTEALVQKRKTLSLPSESTLRAADALDVTLDLPPKTQGHLHLIPQFIRTVEEVFGRMGFDVATGPEIETEDLNFNQLNIPADHPARDAQDTFTIAGGPQSGPQRLVLRTHTSPVQIRYMRSHTPPFRAIFPGRVFRKDADATHSPMVHQFEGLMVGPDISLANMKAVMTTGIRELISPTAEFRFRTGYFPFVEPGLEVDMRWQGDESASREGKWLEVVGCGMVHPNVLKNGGIDPEKYRAFAFGFGIERLIMIKHQIPDLRSFYEGDLRFLKQF
jgi:phenylalanyl-tRNA synthetase alpha chain